MTKNLGFIGFGKMASAICKGVINSGFIKPCNIYAYDVNFEHLKEAAEELKINAVVDVKTLAKNVSNILVATKPFVVDDVLSNLKDVADIAKSKHVPITSSIVKAPLVPKSIISVIAFTNIL